MATTTNGTVNALVGGLVGASALTLLHESARRVRPDAPRMDELGMQALAKMLRRAKVTPPPRDRLHTATLVGDVLANGLYYSLVGPGRDARVWLRGAVLGLGAGIGGVVLPPLLGLDPDASARTTQTKLMTVTWYLLGGLTAAAAARALSGMKG